VTLSGGGVAAGTRLGAENFAGTLRTPRSTAVPAVDTRLTTTPADIRLASTLSNDAVTQRAGRLGRITVTRVASGRIIRAQIEESRLTRVAV